MSTSWPSILKRYNRRHLLEVRSRIKGIGSTVGFVIGYSKELALFHVLDTDMFRLNGYSVIRLDDVKDYRTFDKSQYWQNRAVRRFHLNPVTPAGVLLNSLPELLQSIAKRHPLITFECERTKPNICYIGTLLSMTETTCTIDDLNSNAEWTGPRRLKFADITRISFGDGYSEALAATAPKPRSPHK
jgi:hypothetical protein